MASADTPSMAAISPTVPTSTKNLYDRVRLAEANQAIKAKEEERSLEVIKKSGMEIKGVTLDNKS